MVRQAIAASVTRILLHDPGVGIGDDPEDVHQARVGTRRLRSDLRTFAPLLDDVWVRSRRRELAWLAGCLGAVRDADVMVERFRARAERLGEPDTSALAPVFRQLAKERDDARAELLVAMDSARYVGLLDQLVAAANEPPCRPVAAKAASKVVPRLASRPWRKLAETVRALPDKPPADDLHQVRIAAEAVRYAAEAAAPHAGKKAQAFADAVADLQTVLGHHQDAVVAEAWLQGLAPSAELADSSAVDHLIELQRAEAARQRKRWRRAWTRASNDKLRSWL